MLELVTKADLLAIRKADLLAIRTDLLAMEQRLQTELRARLEILTLRLTIRLAPAPS